MTAPTFAADIIANPNTISSDHSGDKAYGVKETTADASGGVVEVRTGGVIYFAVGGYSDDGNVTDNAATVSGGTVYLRIFGGYSDDGNVTDNAATVSGGTVYHGFFGGSSYEGTASGNTATVSGGKVYGSVFGGASQKGNVTNNTATVSGGEVESVIGGHSRFKGNITNNTATVSGGTVREFVIGGYSYKGDATGNTVNIKKGSSGNPTFGTDTVLYGGLDFDTSTPNDVKSGNTLNMHTTGIKVKNIANFENLHFYVQTDTASGASFLTLSDSDGKGTTITDTNIGICVQNSVSSSLAVGDTLTLLGTQSLSTDATLSNTTTEMDDCSDSHTFSLEKDGENLVAKVTNVVKYFSVGGKVSGLGAGKTVVLQNNAGDDLSVSADGNFTFATQIANGGAYAVSVKTQPAGQTCQVVSNAGGSVSAKVSNVSVTCQNIATPLAPARPVPSLGNKALALLMLLLTAISVVFIRQRRLV